MARTLTLRLFGLAVAAAFAVAAVAFLAFGLGFEVARLTSWLNSTADYIILPFNEGGMALGGAGLVLVALLAAIPIVRKSGTSAKRLAKHPAGATSVDLTGVARVVQRKLRHEVDEGIAVRSTRRRGLVAIVPTYGGSEPLVSVDEAALLLPAVVEQLGVPVTHRVTAGDPSKSRVR